MADPLSTTASLIAILQATVISFNYIQGVRHATSDRIELKSELESLTGILTAVHSHASANPDSTILRTFDPTLRECLSDITKLHAKLMPKGLLRRGMSRLRWPLKDKEISQHMDKIERLKSSISLAMDLDRE